MLDRLHWPEPGAAGAIPGPDVKESPMATYSAGAGAGASLVVVSVALVVAAVALVAPTVAAPAARTATVTRARTRQDLLDDVMRKRAFRAPHRRRAVRGER